MSTAPKRFVYYQHHGTNRGRFVAFGLKLLFGRYPNPSQELIEQFAGTFNQSDELAEQVVAELFGQHPTKAHSYLKQALEHGSTVVDDKFPMLKKLLQQSESIPNWVDVKKVERGQQVIHRCGRFAMYALGDLSLLGGYSNSDIIKPLTFTGALAGNTTFDRVSETTQFWHDVTTLGSLDIGAKGYRTAMHVRIMHGFVRRRLLKHPEWNQDEWGLPINQGDSLATNVAFSMVMFTGCALQGMRFTREDIESVLHLWRYIGCLMGDKHQMLPTTLEEGVEWLYMITLGSRTNPDQECVELAHSYLESYKFFPGNRIKQLGMYWLHRIYANYLIPRNIRQVLNLPSAPLIRLLPLLLVPLHMLNSYASRWVLPYEQWLQAMGRNSQTGIVTERLQGRRVAFEANRKLKK